MTTLQLNSFYERKMYDQFIKCDVLLQILSYLHVDKIQKIECNNNIIITKIHHVTCVFQFVIITIKSQVK